LNKLTQEEQATKAAYDKAAAAWADYFDNGAGWPEELKKFHKLLPSGKILEIGAGTGRDAQELIKLGYDYVGTDISEGLLSIARSKMPTQKFIETSVYDLSFPEKFDGFWASAVLLHIPKKRIDEALNKIKRTQRKNAIGFISIKDGLGEELSERSMGGINTKRFFALWSKDEFEGRLRKADFKIKDYSYRTVTLNTKWHMFIVQVAD
jgi:ubiquinone/menaquinone biosynthesis C-methylase UbiE